MKKIISLIKACMTSDMALFKINKVKKKSLGIALVLFVTVYIMFIIGAGEYYLCEGLSKINLHYVIIPIAVFSTSIMTFMEGIYKSGSLLFNCKDDQLLLSLPIKRSYVIFIRLFKFYVFELMFNTLFFVPTIIVYLLFADSIEISFIITSIVMIFFLPIIPIVLSTILGAMASSISSRFKYKNIVNIVLSFVFIILFFIISSNMDSYVEIIIRNATSISDFITGVYYPAGVYTSLTLDFNILKLLLFIIINIALIIGLIFLLNRYYFSINTRLKSVETTSNVNINRLKYKSTSVMTSLIKKEYQEMFNTPVLVLNSLLGLVIYIVMVFVIIIKFDSFMTIFSSFVEEELNIEFFNQYIALIVLGLLLLNSFMTSITSSLISLEGRGINIIKSLPVETKTILMSKIYFSLSLTTPVFVLGNLLLSIKLKLGIINTILLLLLSVLLPLISHFFGLIINIRFPKLKYDSPTEVVKQSMSTFISVNSGMGFMLLSIFAIIYFATKVDSTIIILGVTVIALIIDIILYLILIHKGVKNFNELSI